MNFKKEIAKVYKKLTKQQQIELYNRMKEGDQEARNILVECCLPMVVKIADQFASNNKHIDFDDLVQEGNLALVKAINVFDPHKYGRVSTLAHHAITNALITMTHKGKYKMKHPFVISSYASKLMKDIEAIESNDAKVIAEKLNRKVKTIKRMKSRMYNRTGIFTSSVTERKVAEEKKPDHFCLGYLVEILGDENLVSPMNSKIFIDYYGISGEKRMTANQIAVKYSMKASAIANIIKKVRRDINKLVKEEKQK